MQLPPVRISSFALTGGLNLVTPPLSMPDGMCRDALNFEVDIDGGYRRVAGYERFDGQPAPSDAIYYILNCTFTGTVAVGNTITGATSGATGYVVAVTSEYIVFTKATGTFVSAENVEVSAVAVAQTTSAAIAAGAPSQLLSATYQNAAADVYRADIKPVPGSGPILGVHRYSRTGKVYAFRNNAGGTECEVYESSSSGWVKKDLGYQIAFENADDKVEEGQILTQGSVTATIKRVVVETGTLVSGTNTGRLIISVATGGNFAAGSATTDGGGVLDLTGAESAITLAPNGRYEVINHNFGGGAGTVRMYGASGTHEAFEFDGDVWVPIRTGMLDDKPKHICAHANHLFLSFNSSLQHASPGDPYQWTIVAGAGEIAMGDTITGMLPMVGAQDTGALIVMTVNKTSVLYGASASDWNLVTYSLESGGLPYTMQNIGAGYVLDSLGIKQIIATDAFGNFADAQITRNVRPFIETRITNSVGSCIVRKRNQYRLLFSDRYCLHVTFDNGKIKGVMPAQYAHTMTCMSSFESSNGEEFIFCGDTDGYVYRMERGTSFDGNEIFAHLNLSFSYMKNPRLRKRFRKVVYEITGGNYAEMQATYELGYSSSDIDQGVTSNIATPLGNAFWDDFTWDSFFWDGRTLLPAEQELTGTAENISLIIRSASDIFEPYTVNSAIIQFTERRLLR